MEYAGEETYKVTSDCLRALKEMRWYDAEYMGRGALSTMLRAVLSEEVTI